MTEAYPDLSRITDPVIAQTLRLVWDRIHAVEGRVGDPIVLRDRLDANSNRLSDVADPTQDQDAVTKKFAESNYGAEAVFNELLDGGAFPLDVENLPGVLAEPQRMGIQVIPDTDELPLSAGTNEVVFWRGVLYYWDVTTPPGRWVPLSSAAAIITGTHQERLDDFPPADFPRNLNFWETDYHILYRIVLDSTTNTHKWKVMEAMGYMRDTFANRPLASTLDFDTDTDYNGLWFRATDRGEQAWRFTQPTGLTSRWTLVPGWGEPMEGTLSPDEKPSLTTFDSGFRFFSTDFAREFVWSGASWADADDAPNRYEISFFNTTPEPATGWQRCDGTATTRSTSAGATAAFTAPDLTTAGRYLESDTVAGTTGGNVTHTHTISGSTGGTAPNTGGPSGTVEVQSGTGVTVSTSNHTHTVNNHSHTFGSLFGDAADGRPPFYTAIPYIRL